MGFSMNSVICSLPLRSLAVLSLLLLGVGCNPVDPLEGLDGLTVRCVNQEACAPGFVCDEGRCVVRAGEACREGFDVERCAMRHGVCATARRACVNGVVAASCSPRDYGPTYEALETTCDGLDTDCDGVADMAVRPLALAGVCTTAPCNLVQLRMVPFGEGVLAVMAHRVTPGTTTAPSDPTQLHVQVLDRSLQAPPGGAPQLLHQEAGLLSDLRVVPYAGGAFIQWMGPKVITREDGRTHTAQVARIARVDVGVDGQRLSVGLSPRELHAFRTWNAPRLAVSHDSQRLFVAWRLNPVRGQVFSLSLEPLTEELVVGASHPGDPANSTVMHVDVAAHGSTDFLLGWGLTSPDQPGTTTPTAPNAVRFRRLSASLEPLGEMVGLEGELRHFADLRLLGSPRADVAPLAAWLTLSPYVEGRRQDMALRYAQPFAPGAPRSPPLPVLPSMGTLDLERDDEGQALLALHRESSSPRAVSTPVVLRVDAAFGTEERRVVTDAGWNYQGASFIPGAAPGTWGLGFLEHRQVNVGANNWEDRYFPHLASVCRF